MLAELLLLTALASAPDSGAVSVQPCWHLDAGVSFASPTVLEFGLGYGVAAQLQRRLGDGPWLASGRVSWNLVDGANESWAITHHQAAAALGVGAALDIGAGRLWGQAGGGLHGVFETLTRHQGRRIAEAGVPDANRTSWTLGPYAFAEAGVALRLGWGLRAVLSGGPTLTFSRVDGRQVRRLGGFGEIGAGYEF